MFILIIRRFSQDLRLADMTLPGASINVAFRKQSARQFPSSAIDLTLVRTRSMHSRDSTSSNGRGLFRCRLALCHFCLVSHTAILSTDIEAAAFARVRRHHLYARC